MKFEDIIIYFKWTAHLRLYIKSKKGNINLDSEETKRATSKFITVPLKFGLSMVDMTIDEWKKILKNEKNILAYFEGFKRFYWP